MEVLYLSRRDVEKVNVSVKEVIDSVREAYREKGLGYAEMPPKPGIHPREEAFIHAMPAYLPRVEAAGLKWVSGYLSNPKKGLPYIMGLLILNDPDTGAPIAVMDATWITAYRTGASTAVTAEHLARRDSESIGIIGCGVQGRSNLEALVEVFSNTTTVYAFDIDGSKLEKYKSEMEGKLGVDIIACKDPRVVVENSDIVVTATPILKKPKPVVEAEWVKRGSLAVPLDFDSYWKPEAIKSMDKIYTDDKEQLFYYKTLGYFKAIDRVEGEISEVILGKVPGRTSDDEKIMSMNLGVAVLDVAVAKLVFEKAKKKGVGVWLPL